MKFYLIIFLLTFLTVFGSCSENEESIESIDSPIVLLNGIIIDGTGSDPLENHAILIENGNIAQIRKKAEISMPENAQVINLNGAYILPGLINSHVHSAFDNEKLTKWAYEGVTTVRDMNCGGMSAVNASKKHKDLSKKQSNARLIYTSLIIKTEGGYGHFTIKDVEDAKKKTKELIENGVHQIKIAIEDDLQLQQWKMLSQDEINAISEVTHNNNTQISAHISKSFHIDYAIEGGIDDLNHMVIDNLSSKQAGKVVNNNIYWVPTLELWNIVSNMHPVDYITQAIENLKTFVETGGKVSLGTDFGGYMGDFDLGLPKTEIQLMQKAGMTPMQIITSATKNASEVCGINDVVGTISENKVADILIVKNNPLEDLNNLENVVMVIHNGIIIRDENKLKL